MRLHILRDQKIINRTIDYFEAVFPDDNKYIVLLENSDTEPRYVSTDICKNVYCEKYDSPSFWNAIGRVDDYNQIIIHFLSIYAAEFINKIQHPCIMWIEWGGDLYDQLLSRRGFPLYQDPQLVAKMQYPRIPYLIYKLIKKYKTDRRYSVFSNAIRKIRFFIPDSMYDEYPLLLKYYPEFSHLEYRDFFYYPIDDILGPLKRKTSTGFDIMLGNSCSFTNNHIYALNYLKSKNLSNRIIAPLSYSGNERYKRHIISVGKQLFGNNFYPITSYMNLNDYNKLLLNANSFIYANFRQEAVGNILVALYLGGKVFLDKINPLLPFYKAKGLSIFGLDDISYDSINTRLAETEVIENRRIIDDMYSGKRMLDLISSTFS